MKTILIGVGGGVAAYKGLELVSALRREGHTVKVVMSEAATRFVTPTSFAAVSGAPVATSLWPEVSRGTMEDHFPHLYPSTRADLFLLLPATANRIAKLSLGIGDDLLGTCALSLPAGCARVFCPSMNVEMWGNPVVRENVRRLEDLGWIRIGPDSGHLACGMRGAGRMAEPGEILGRVRPLLGGGESLRGKTLLIFSGPTREFLDPVRYLGNPSSGRMGKALAEAAAARGASVHLITGPVAAEHLPACARIEAVTSAEEMLAAGRNAVGNCDGVLYAAAVADYRPAVRAEVKTPKQEKGLRLELVPNPDIAATLNRIKPAGVPAIGFALQSHDGEMRAREKLEAKGFDGIVLNGPENLSAPAGAFAYLARGAAEFEDWGSLPKSAAAERIVDRIAALLG